METTSHPSSVDQDPLKLDLRGVSESKRRRRPSGQPPPLPRELGASGVFWIAMIAALVAFVVFLALSGIGAPIERFEDSTMRWMVRWRTNALTHIMLFINGLGSRWTNRALRWGTLLVLISFRRWRHLLVFVATIVFVQGITHWASLALPRARPLGMRIIGTWEGFSFPSRPVAAFCVTALGITYTLVVPGRSRQWSKLGFGVLILALGWARTYLALDHPTDVLFGMVLGVGIPLLAYRTITPNSVFPVAYRRGRSAHLDVGGRRGRAITQAVQDQLGLTVLEIKPFGLGGSGGSTPLRLLVAGDPERHVFAKLYAKTHLRADRWYKVGRTILYGTLEDEKSYNSVRRLVQYEDYVMRVMHDAGIPCARSFGFVEITPEREYLLVTEFLPGTEITEAEVTDAIIDDALATVRLLWDAGLSHRDIKPANILVRGDKIVLIDLAFGEIRPSPWRQAVDLANMMVVLAVTTEDADRVYHRALEFFSPDEIAEALAASRSVTMPSQSRNLLRKLRKQGSNDMLKRFRDLAPTRRQIAIQRWSLQRVALTLGVLIGALIAVQLIVNAFSSGAL